jgi:hypothetical protein
MFSNPGNFFHFLIFVPHTSGKKCVSGITLISGVVEGDAGDGIPPNNLEGGWHPPNNQVSRGML